MKKWIKNVTVGLVIPSLLLLAGCAGANGGQKNSAPAPSQPASTSTSPTPTSNGIKERTLKAGIGLNEDHPEALGLKKFVELVDKSSGGKIKVQPFFAATLGDDLKMTQALQGGTQEITIPSTSPLVGMIKEYGIFDFPFVFNNEKEADAVLDGPLGQKLLDKLPAQKLVGLAYWENGFRNLTNSKHAVAKAEDFQGLKIRTMQNKVHLEAFKALGANPTPMAFSEVFTALESKTVDGQENPLATIQSSKFNEVQKYLSLTKHVYTPFVFLMSKKYWDQLSPEEQKIMKEAAVEAGKYQRELIRDVNKKAVETLKASGMNVNEVTPEDAAKMQKIIKPVTDKFAKEFGEDLVKEMYDEVEKLRKK
ncbi:TRAP transporter substrate-binding protein [Paenibacillus alginolyticus]|uniref:TRAP transporter substrate-binding protein n=1 Tax=Paenibacillus alginolyticus TaxID=59839 RepID=UPI000417DD33|nr:TRAP transporter substrate-binding protein [Paenibacillus alginolyticus]MCY9670373.1 TRAP transporter substrate-binding protein [Paenibacillus alginolyticus]